MPTEGDKKHNWFLTLIGSTALISIFVSFYFFYFKKDYNFLVETKCDPKTETCFYRDCSNPDDCPPNGLSYYKQYNVKAYDFKSCENEDCTKACNENLISCEQISCTKDDIDQEVCVIPENNLEQIP